jgi:hypothetical protein
MVAVVLYTCENAIVVVMVLARGRLCERAGVVIRLYGVLCGWRVSLLHPVEWCNRDMYDV